MQQIAFSIHSSCCCSGVLTSSAMTRREYWTPCWKISCLPVYHLSIARWRGTCITQVEFLVLSGPWSRVPSWAMCRVPWLSFWLATVSPDLCCRPKEEPIESPAPLSLLSQRHNIYDGDEFDVFKKGTVDMTRVHQGKYVDYSSSQGSHLPIHFPLY